MAGCQVLWEGVVIRGWGKVMLFGVSHQVEGASWQWAVNHKPELGRSTYGLFPWLCQGADQLEEESVWNCLGKSTGPGTLGAERREEREDQDVLGQGLGRGAGASARSR